HLDHEQPVGRELGRDDVVDLAGGVAGAAHLDAHVLGRDRAHAMAGVGAGGAYADEALALDRGGRPRRQIERPGQAGERRRAVASAGASPRSSRQPRAAAKASPAPRPFTTSTGYGGTRSRPPSRRCTVAPSGPCFWTTASGPRASSRSGAFAPTAAAISSSDPSTRSAIRAQTRIAAA